MNHRANTSPNDKIFLDQISKVSLSGHISNSEKLRVLLFENPPVFLNVVECSLLSFVQI